MLHFHMYICIDLIKSYLSSICLSLTDSKVIKLLKGVTGKTSAQIEAGKVN